ncbi:MAG: NAD(P)-dependent oxidoreductase, partial [Flavobacteriales bacterium]|nr:NAD(P)-dependent oxidoreductase [Flavobacteriales bacterium]
MTDQRIFITGITSFLLRDLATRLRDRGNTCIGLSRQSISMEGIELIHGDLLQPDTWRDHLATCDMVIHGAAITHSHDENLYEQVNHLATRALVDACDPGQRFVFISSRVAGMHSGAYGVSKFRAEEYIRSHCPDHLILRPSEVFGGGKEEGIESLIRTVLQKRLVVYPGGVGTPLCPIHVKDLVDNMEEIILQESHPDYMMILRGPQCMGFKEIVQT